MKRKKINQNLNKKIGFVEILTQDFEKNSIFLKKKKRTFLHTFHNIAHLFRPKIQFGLYWKEGGFRSQACRSLIKIPETYGNFFFLIFNIYSLKKNLCSFGGKKLYLKLEKLAKIVKTKFRNAK